MADVFYAVIALKKREVPGVVERLKAQRLNDLAQWFENSQAKTYGNLNDQWRPFNGKTISELIKESSEYKSGTDVIDALDDLLSNLYQLRKAPITVYFIDAFALFLEKYATLARTIDYAVSQEAFCCFLINDDMPQQVKTQLRQRYCSDWKVVCWSYEEGKPHRIVSGLGDLKNFIISSRNRVQSPDGPSGAADRDLTNRTDWVDGPFPALAGA